MSGLLQVRMKVAAASTDTTNAARKKVFVAAVNKII
jgi:hypothetical protein